MPAIDHGEACHDRIARGADARAHARAGRPAGEISAPALGRSAAARRAGARADPRPRFIVADEPVSMLDVSVRAGILNLMREIQQSLGLDRGLHLARPRAGALCRAPHAGHVSRPHRGGRADRARGLGAAASLYASAGRRGADPARRPGRAGRCRSAATCRTRATRPPAAASTTAARLRLSAAATRCRCYARWRRGTARRAIWCRQSSGAATFASWQNASRVQQPGSKSRVLPIREVPACCAGYFIRSAILARAARAHSSSNWPPGAPLTPIPPMMASPALMATPPTA